jgi:tetratricopeptide (TPR) repeat protein
MLCKSTTEYYRELFHATVKNYQQGCAKPLQLAPETSDRLADKKSQALIEKRLPLTDQLIMRRFDNARTRGLIATRSGNLIMAERAFTAARAPLLLSKLSLEGSLLYQSLLEQAASYLDYRQGNFDQARNRIYEALAIDLVLEEEYEYDMLLLHRIQLVHNLARIDANCMYLERAIELICRILNYLEGTSEALPIPGDWGYERVTRQPVELVTAMFAQVTSEIAIILAGKNSQVVRHLFVVISTNLQLQTCNNYCCHPRAYSWLLVKQAFASNDFANFLELASQFLNEGRADIPLLWYATVIDLVALCDELDLPDSKVFRQDVASLATTWEYLPQKFFSLLGVELKTAAA